MLVYKDGKLYLLQGEKAVGVNISIDRISIVKGTEVELEQPYRQITVNAVRRKFGITESHPYKFPKPRKPRAKKDSAPKGEDK